MQSERNPHPAAEPANDESGTPSTWRMAAPALALVVGAVALVAVALGVAAWEVDRAAEEATDKLAETAFSGVETAMGRLVTDYARSDDTLKFVASGTVDADWAHRRLGPDLFETFGTSATLVVSADDRVVFASREEIAGPFEQSDVDLLRDRVKQMIERARAQPMDRAQAVVGYIQGVRALMIVGVAPITPERPTEADLVERPRPALVFLRSLDADALTEIAAKFNLPDLRVVEIDRARPVACRPLEGTTGEAAYAVEWQPPRPGIDLLRRAAPPTAVILALLLSIGAVVLRQSLRSRHELVRRAEELALANERLVQNESSSRSALQRAEHATRAKSSFLAGVSHELRTPLTAIIGFSQILKLQHRTGRTKTREQEYVEIIHDSSQHLLNLVNDILDLSKIESGGYELREAWVDLRREIGAVRTLLAVEADRRGIAMDIELPDDLPALYGDGKAVRQMVTNLVANALKFTERGGRIVIRVTQLSGGRLGIEVTDNGTGISAADQRGIWEPFTRARNPALTKTEGTGLGLHMVKILADLHGAEVELESALGEGTRVAILFSADRVRAVAA